MTICLICKAEFDETDASRSAVSKKLKLVCNKCITKINEKAALKAGTQQSSSSSRSSSLLCSLDFGQSSSSSPSSGSPSSLSSTSYPLEVAKCKACGKVLKGSSYAHAIIPQSLLKKTNLIFLQFLTLLPLPTELDPEARLVPMPVILADSEGMDRLLGDIEARIQECDASSSVTTYRGCTRVLAEFLQKNVFWPLSDVACTGIGQLPFSINSLDQPGFTDLQQVIGQAGSLQRFGISSQCDACEAAHGDDAFILRCDRVVKGEKGEDHVGREYVQHLPARDCKNSRWFTWQWLSHGFPEVPAGVSVISDIVAKLAVSQQFNAKVILKLLPIFVPFYKLQMLALAEKDPACLANLAEALPLRHRELEKMCHVYRPASAIEDFAEQDSGLDFAESESFGFSTSCSSPSSSSQERKEKETATGEQRFALVEAPEDAVLVPKKKPNSQTATYSGLDVIADFLAQKKMWKERIEAGQVVINGEVATLADLRRFTYQDLEKGIWVQYTGSRSKSYKLQIQ